MKKIFNIIGLAAGLLAIVLAIVSFSMDEGGYVSSRSYGGDAYTGIQNAAAYTANNVMRVGRIVRFGFGAVLIVGGIALISANGAALFEKKENKSALSAPAHVNQAPVYNAPQAPAYYAPQASSPQSANAGEQRAPTENTPTSF